ncbi:proline-rich protein 18 [Callorhinchus milii]|uniref:proline-rich protein 18 n=1 Tax=Callorhinchus milii TaxID=7868 RepID=UPI001C3F52D6|nr:proline-rich protein 18 [Callorhinchus milii]
MRTHAPSQAETPPYTSRPASVAKRDAPFPPIHQPAPVAGRDRTKRAAKAERSQPVPPPALGPRAARRGGGGFPHSWPKPDFQPGRRPQPRRQQQRQQHPAGRAAVGPARLPAPKAPGGSCDSVPASLSGDSSSASPLDTGSAAAAANSGEEARFSLSLTPEAVLVIRKRHLERQLRSGVDAGAASDLRRKRLLTNRRSCPRAALPQARPRSPADIRTLLKISLLNDRHKYDDVEYEEEEEEDEEGAEGREAAAEEVMERCREWLKGVESAHGKPDLPRLVS